mmetsp:Transcript_9379/g.28952  ORF Transcript_9379/g.28952 Transcript_9379/m.28952 type:complete len:260 (+) Transcript_9379:89-868(+)
MYVYFHTVTHCQSGTLGVGDHMTTQRCEGELGEERTQHCLAFQVGEQTTQTDPWSRLEGHMFPVVDWLPPVSLLVEPALRSKLLRILAPHAFHTAHAVRAPENRDTGLNTYARGKHIRFDDLLWICRHRRTETQGFVQHGSHVVQILVEILVAERVATREEGIDFGAKLRSHIRMVGQKSNCVGECLGRGISTGQKNVQHNVSNVLVGIGFSLFVGVKQTTREEVTFLGKFGIFFALVDQRVDHAIDEAHVALVDQFRR